MTKKRKKEIKKKSEKKKFTGEDKLIFFCPRCKSIDVKKDRSNKLSAFGLPERFLCNNCLHVGYNFPEVMLSKLSEFEEEIKYVPKPIGKDDSEKVDTSYGEFIVRVIWKAESILITIVGLLIILKEKNILIGIIYLLLGPLMFYVTYFKKFRLKDKESKKIGE